MPLRRMLHDNRTFDPKAVALLLEAFDEIVAALDLRTDANREKAAKIVMRLAHGQNELDALKIRAEVVLVDAKGRRGAQAPVLNKALADREPPHHVAVALGRPFPPDEPRARPGRPRDCDRCALPAALAFVSNSCYALGNAEGRIMDHAHIASEYGKSAQACLLMAKRSQNSVDWAALARKWEALRMY